MLRNHLRANSPEVEIRNNFVGINLATIVASFIEQLSKFKHSTDSNKHFRI